MLRRQTSSHPQISFRIPILNSLTQSQKECSMANSLKQSKFRSKASRCKKKVLRRLIVSSPSSQRAKSSSQLKSIGEARLLHLKNNHKPITNAIIHCKLLLSIHLSACPTLSQTLKRLRMLCSKRRNDSCQGRGPGWDHRPSQRPPSLLIGTIFKACT